MKILFIAMRFRRDGFATNVLDLTQGLVERGHEIHLITSGFLKSDDQGEDTYFKKLQQDLKDWGVKVYYFKEPKGNVLKKGILSITETLKVLSYILKINADIIHAQSPNTTLFPWLLGKKYISTVHTDTIRPNFSYKHPDLLISVSSGSKDFTEKIMGTDPKTVRIVHHGISKRFADRISKEEINRLKQQNKIPTDKIIVGFVGRLIKAKGLDVLINAVAHHLPKEVLDKIHLVLVGHFDDAAGEKWLMDLVEQEHLEKKVSILPFQDPKPVYQMFDIFTLPSRIDTFGLVAVEAMMSGCCTIRANSYGATDQIDHGKSGFIYDMEDAKQLGNLLNQVVNDDGLRNKLALAGKEKALIQFTKDSMVEKTLAVYEELMLL
ncbi:glycosyltransferase family 4 protein [Maribacter sp. Asnod2-G09]|uniref:glycosyltransferase family 4 protein n=1 Tax=Maribacter sp. Asnod2-G09 TaxID=3160577 RepID=UPI00386B5389